MNILILGGTTESRLLASELCRQHNVFYSLKSPVYPQKNIGKLIVQTWHNSQELQSFIQQNSIDLLLDVTHPYAQKISYHAYQATQYSRCHLLSYYRLGWVMDIAYCKKGSIPFILKNTQSLSCLMWACGKKIHPYLSKKPKQQRWIISQLQSNFLSNDPSIQFISSFQNTIFETQNIDALICKNSGGAQGYKKIECALKQKINLWFLPRPDQQAHQLSHWKTFKMRLTALLNT